MNIKLNAKATVKDVRASAYKLLLDLAVLYKLFYSIYCSWIDKVGWLCYRLETANSYE